MTQLILSLLLGTLLLVIYSNYGVQGLTKGLTAALAALPLYVALVLWLDRHEPEPHALLAWAFFWGASGATFLSFVANTLFATTGLLYDPVVADFLSGAFFAPMAEELSKGALLMAFFHWYPEEFDNVTDGIVYAAMVGLGFATTENVLYYAAAFVAGPEVLSELWMIRGVASPFAHPLFTASLGLSLGIARERSVSAAGQTFAVAAGLTGAILLHSIWNFAAMTGAMGPVYRFGMVPIFIGFLLLLRCALKREAEVIERELRPYISSGDLEVDQVRHLYSWSLRIRSSGRAFGRAGSRGLREQRRFHQAATELAFQRWRIGRGIETAEAARPRIEFLVACISQNSKRAEPYPLEALRTPS